MRDLEVELRTGLPALQTREGLGDALQRAGAANKLQRAASEQEKTANLRGARGSWMTCRDEFGRLRHS